MRRLLARVMGVRRIPLCGQHGPGDLFLGAEQRDVDGIAGNPGGGMGQARGVEELRMLPDIPLPNPRSNHIRGEEIQQEQDRSGLEVEAATPPCRGPG